MNCHRVNDRLDRSDKTGLAKHKEKFAHPICRQGPGIHILKNVDAVFSQQFRMNGKCLSGIFRRQNLECSVVGADGNNTEFG